MQAKYLWITATTFITAVICGGLWIMFKSHTQAKLAIPMQDVLMEHVEYFPEVYRAHENYAGQLQNDTYVLIFRYSSNMCVPCYQNNLIDLREFVKTAGNNTVLILPAYPFNDRRSRIRINSETNGFKYQNIPTDSLALPVHENGSEMQYFAVVDTLGRIGMVFFPHADYPEITQAYFKEVERRMKQL